MILLVAFAILALLLATIGIYGVISYSTTQSVPEIGVRMALGASKWDVLQMLLRHGLRLALIGVAIGAAAALVLTRVLSSFSHLLYGVRKTDPSTFAVVFTLSHARGSFGLLYPSSPGSAVGPMTALRHE
jgi:ABC-type antimicrobial peptide transport system permease subunit